METFKSIAEFLGISIQPLIFTFVIELAFVYLLGRMLMFIEKPRYKNLIAALVGIPGSYISTIGFTFNFEMGELKNTIFVYCASMILYVLIGFKLYNRINHLQDKVIADDDGNNANDDKPVEKKKPAKKSKRSTPK